MAWDKKADQEYHPKAVWEMRWPGNLDWYDGPGQQCTYNAEGILITGYKLASGTPDKEAGIPFNVLDHYKQDVKPFNIAQELDKKKFGKYTKLYFQQRPPCSGGGTCYE